jgi:vacuolar-type H+-ATPase subunit I/STV1
MKKTIWARGLMISMILGVFALGFLLGTVNQRYAAAQKIPGMGDVLDKAGKSGGALGSVTQLGSSIVEMQDHVNGLQKNLETLKKIQSALGGK